MLRLLFVEDDPGAIENVRELARSGRGFDECWCSFEDAVATIGSYQPDIVILDLLSGNLPRVATEGFETRNFIWESRFCPIVIYSAAPEYYEEEPEYEEHPFVKSVKKGSGSPERVLRAVEELRPQVDALKEAEKYIRQCLACAMRDVAPYAFEAHTDAELRNETIRRAGRRHLAAQMDDLSIAQGVPQGWEQYLFPPVCQDPRLGDVLRMKDGNIDDPTSFRLVLTPSCDMVAAGGRTPKVNQVLVAACCSMREGLNRTSLKDDGPKKLLKHLGPVLARGHIGSILPLPRLPQRIPTMAADMRDLHLIALAKIGSGGDGKEFFRVASIDSPFRETIAWAYLQSAGHPGMPDRDLRHWKEEIVRTLG